MRRYLCFTLFFATACADEPARQIEPTAPTAPTVKSTGILQCHEAKPSLAREGLSAIADTISLDRSTRNQIAYFFPDWVREIVLVKKSK